MAFDKEKTLRAAEKYLEMGKIPAAIKEYCKLVEGEPDDFTTLNILGDLHVRVGNQAAAVSCFHRIAEHYREQDFALKAIAMFKKIDRLQPNDLNIANTLAGLYAEQDLIVEARAHYLILANAYAKAGDTQAGLEVLRKIADLDPQNTEVRIKLAESYLSEGRSRDAVASFAQAGQNLLARGEIDEALELFTKALNISPEDYAALSGLLAAHTARRTADEAAEIIGRAAADNPDDTELLSMLANAYVEAEDCQRAEAATLAYVAKDASAYLRLLDVARLYLRTSSVDDAARVVQGIAEQMLAEREAFHLLEIVNELLTSDADNVQALRLLARAHWWQRDAENLKAALERLAEAAEATGLQEDERYALTQLTRLMPEESRYTARLNELGGAEAQAIAEALPEFDVAGSAEPASAPEANEAASEPATPVIETEFEFEATEPAVETEFAFDTFAEAPEHETQPVEAMEIERGFAFEVPADDIRATDESVGESVAVEDDRHAAIRAQELESVDFYIAQGYVDIAIDTLDLLERQFGSHPDIERRRRQLAGEAEEAEPHIDEHLPSEPVAAFELAESPSFTVAPLPAEQTPMAPPPPVQIIDPGLAEIFEEYRESAEAESNGNGDYETHYNLGLAYQEMDLFEEALEEFQIAVGLVSPDDGTARYLQCCNLLGHCFLNKGVPQLAIKWFGKGLSAPTATDDQRQALRFDLAAAYEQAGELNRAMDLFTEIYGVNVSYRGVNERLRSLQSRIAQ